MGAKKFILLAAGFALLFLLALGLFNYSVDPFCYYCRSVDVGRPSLNRYYQVAQTIVGNPDAEQIILGSSRGETTSPLWVQSLSGLKTLNLSAAGEEFYAKKAFLNIALKANQLKKVIWLADYFELISSNVDQKIKRTLIFQKYLSQTQSLGLLGRLHELQQLLDHNVTEASFAALKRSSASLTPSQGVGSEINTSACEQADFHGKETIESLRQEVDLVYDSYVHGAIRPAQNSEAMIEFKDMIQQLHKKGVALLIVIPPYNPNFMTRLKMEYPDIYEAHLRWIDELRKLEGPGIEVKSFFDGIPNDHGLPADWNDGVHFTCKGAMQMLAPLVKR